MASQLADDGEVEDRRDLLGVLFIACAEAMGRFNLLSQKGHSDALAFVRARALRELREDAGKVLPGYRNGRWHQEQLSLAM